MSDQPRSLMSPFGRQLFAIGLRLNRQPPHAVRMAQIQAEIAALLGEAMAVDLGLTAVNLDLLPAGTRARLSTLAMRAIEWLDPDVRIDAAAEAVAETMGWACSQHEVRPDELLREGLARYEAILSKPNLPVLGASPDAVPVESCRFCPGVVVREPSGRTACDTCGEVWR